MKREEAIRKCPPIILDPCPTYLKLISDFSSNEIPKAKREIDTYEPLNYENIKGVWILVGYIDFCKKWICLEVGSSSNIKSEIRSALGCMESVKKEVYKDSEFYKGAELFPFVEFSDRISCKYRAITEFCSRFRYFEIDPYSYIKTKMKKKISQNKNEVCFKNEIVGIVNFVEVHFAFIHKALLWNPAPQTNGNKEKIVLGILNNSIDIS